MSCHQSHRAKTPLRGILPLLCLALCAGPLSGCVTGKDRPEDGGGGVTGDGPRPKADLKVQPPSEAGPRPEQGTPKPDQGRPQGDRGVLPVDGGGISRPGWVKLNPGSFWMGSPVGELCRGDDEARHKVTLSHTVEMMQKEVTQAQFKAKMNYNPTDSKDQQCGADCPVGAVTWHQAATYCNKLSAAEGKEQCYLCSGDRYTEQCETAGAYVGAGKTIADCKGYRLPTDAEWEYAYRAGTTWNFPSGQQQNVPCSTCGLGGTTLAQQAWFCANGGTAVKKGGQKAPNNWGLHDMGGSMWEWCDDWYVKDLGTAPQKDPWQGVKGTDGSTAGHKVRRGGFFLNGPWELRAASRDPYDPSTSSSARRGNGFRCVRTLK